MLNITGVAHVLPVLLSMNCDHVNTVDGRLDRRPHQHQISLCQPAQALCGDSFAAQQRVSLLYGSGVVASAMEH